MSYLWTVLGKAAIVARPPATCSPSARTAPTWSWPIGCCARVRSPPIRAARPRTCARRLPYGAGWPLADLAGLAWLEQQADRLDLLREQIRHASSEARLDAGRRQLIPELEQMAADYPLDEQVHAQLMTALYRSGRQADALAVYQRLRAILAGRTRARARPALRELETAILRQDATLDACAPAVSLRPAAPASVRCRAAAAAGGGVRRP